MKTQSNAFSVALNRVIDKTAWAAITVIVLTVGLIVLVGVVVSCKGPDKKKEARDTALYMLEQTVENPGSLKILAVSDMDSVFGTNYINDSELMVILDNLYSFNARTFGDKNFDLDMEDPVLAERIMRGSSISDILQRNTERHYDNAPDPVFSSWKLKVVYSHVNHLKDTVKNERFFIFDRDIKRVLHSFDIPIL